MSRTTVRRAELEVTDILFLDSVCMGGVRGGVFSASLQKTWSFECMYLFR